ncbi:GNAT family acetyltransferase [Staphylococcus petrasii]|uniref:GNAT family N-acetyltransferase n=1 Tax=Staphylococcus petrasii TaxID=1276936 RepID=A0A380FXV8_9STAP|nr:GNAT family N-acetyltransferase [Staphylococcus petrasii]PNZ28604.1 GNAT family N-acetyltransferase [Staphylococcus petrasii]TGE11884.1 GNAT family N-acetyltransferase [Staphylococcus petrasii]TGE16302.1 GNAT family N-acetyltransferase [Staphylococcus petrasii]SUM42783.1 GNAT family acetyltransferase [Staphylococcus petrasii]
MKFRKVTKEDLPTLIELENKSFTPEEAATPEAIAQRIEIIPDTFIIAEQESEIAGYINGPVIPQKYITDDLFETIRPNPNIGGYLSVLGLVVSEKYQGQGLGGQLLNQFENTARKNARFGVTLTCRDTLVPFYEKYGYINEGLSESQHAGVEWYNLVKEL